MFNDIICMNKQIAEQAFQRIKKNWYIVFLAIIYAIINIIVTFVIGIVLNRGPFALIGGFLIAIVSAALVSHYLYMLNQVIKTGKINKYDIKDGFMAYIWKIYGVYFVFWIAGLLLSKIQLGVILPVVVIMALNVLPETLYLKYYDTMDTIKYSLEFMKENWIEWYIPNSIIMIIVFFYTGNVFNSGFKVLINISVTNIVVFIAGQLLFNYFMIYRGLLFELLSTSTRRKREFMRSCKK